MHPCACSCMSRRDIFKEKLRCSNITLNFFGGWWWYLTGSWELNVHNGYLSFQLKKKTLCHIRRGDSNSLRIEGVAFVKQMGRGEKKPASQPATHRTPKCNFLILEIHSRKKKLIIIMKVSNPPAQLANEICWDEGFVEREEQSIP